ncbi:2-succinylbenzoate--CoA ligase [Cylindrospermopsis raciborskii]|uniref:2-succinylbenzoate--CoA ligase n=1 Tax=Cylindrospermopsis raciborskii TaxID=77022 RepID=UPI003DA28EC6
MESYLLKSLSDLEDKNISRENWLIVKNGEQFEPLVKELYGEIRHQLDRQIDHNHEPVYKPLKIILAQRDPVKFLAGFIAGCAAECAVFLCNPDWEKNEWEQVWNLVKPDIIWGDEIKFPDFTTTNIPEEPMISGIMIPTGGSSGKIKFAIHTWETLTASVWGFTEYFNLSSVNSFCVLPLYHVSGLMQFIRSFTTGGKLVITSFKQLTSESNQTSDIYKIKNSDFFISLVPTQLQKLLDNQKLTQWLSEFETVLLGGGPSWNDLLIKARANGIRLAPTYGMTETASQIATLKPDEFLKIAPDEFLKTKNSGRTLPHAEIVMEHFLENEHYEGNHLGAIRINAKSLALGYYPTIWQDDQGFLTDDMGFLDQNGYLHIMGRRSNKIISGGENIYPPEVEAAIRATNLIMDVCVIGIPDHNWGEALTAIYVPQSSPTPIPEIKNQLQQTLTRFKIPKYWIPVVSLPRNQQGKINISQLQQIVLESLDRKMII